MLPFCSFFSTIPFCGKLRVANAAEMRMNRTCIIHTFAHTKTDSQKRNFHVFFLTDGMEGNFGNPFAHIYFPNGGEREIAARLQFWGGGGGGGGAGGGGGGGGRGAPGGRGGN